MTTTSERTVGDYLTDSFELLPEEKIIGDSRATHWHDPLNVLTGRLYSTNFRLIFSPSKAVFSNPWTTILGLRHNHVFKVEAVRAVGNANAPVWFAFPTLFLISTWYIEVAAERHYFNLPLSSRRRVVALLSERYNLPIGQSRALWS